MNERNKMLAKEPIGKLLTRLSVPGMIAMLAGALYNLVDAIFIGKGVDPLAIGGLAIAFPVMMIIMAVALGVGVGAASVVSRALGSKDYERADIAAGNSFVVVGIFGVLITVLGLVFLDELMYLFGATDAIIGYATEYMRIIFYGTILFTFSMSGNNLIRAEGNAKVAMISMLIGVLLNIGLDPLFIFVFDMGIAGAAWATVISRIFSFIWVIGYFLSGKSSLKIKWHHLKLKMGIVKEILSLGMASMLRQLAMSLFLIVLNNSIKHYGAQVPPITLGGEEVSAASVYISLFGIVQRILSFLFMPMFGIVQGFQPIVGFNYGAKNSERVNKTIKLSVLVTVILGTLAFLIIVIFPAPLIKLFTDELKMVELGITPLRVVMIMMPLVGVQIIGGALFQAIGKAVPALFLSVSRQVIFLIPFILLFPFLLGIPGFWWAFPAADFFAIIITSIFMLREMKHINKLQPEPEP